MGIESEADRLAMLRDLGSALFIGTTPVPCIFDRGYTEVQASDRVIAGEMVTARVTSMDAHRLGVQRGTICNHEGERFLVEEIHPDGTGITILILGNNQ